MQTIQMHLSQIQKIFSHFLSAVFKSALNFKRFQEKMNLIAYVFRSLRTTKEVLRYMSKRSPLRGPLDRGHGKRAEALIQY